MGTKPQLIHPRASGGGGPDHTSQKIGAGGGGGEGDGGLPARVKTLEDDMKRLLQDTAEIKGLLRAAPSAVDFGELKGRVNALPTTGKVTAIISAVGAVVTLALKWKDIAAYLAQLVGP